MAGIFEKRDEKRVTRDRYTLNVNISRRNQVTFGIKSLKLYEQKIWNALPVNIKTAENLNAFKDLIKKWHGVSCNCIVCTHYVCTHYVYKNFNNLLNVLFLCI